VRHRLQAWLLLLALFAFAGCDTENADFEGIQSARLAMNTAIQAEPPGDYFIGRRYYKQDYKFWGYLRRPGQPWSTAKLVMLNEQQKLAPDRQMSTIGSDNNYEYTIYGRYSGDTVYEPASNGFYPEFVLTGYELRSASPAIIFHDPEAASNPARRVILPPY
jgi:hypothetical protein